MSVSLLRTALARGRRHLSPFLMLGDPTPALSVELCRRLVDAGASMLELGLPFADPSADGPAVQAAGLRARSAGVSTREAFEVMTEVRAACPDTPLNLLVYGNLVHARGYQVFCREAVVAGASSLLVPDIPLEEGEGLRAACRAAGLGVVLLAGPRTIEERLTAIAAASDAFVYLTGHQGVTGAAADADARRQWIARAVAAIDAPVCVGFGLRSREDVAEVHAAGAQLAVVGSHLLRSIECSPLEDVVDAVEQTFRSLLPSAFTTTEDLPC